MTVPPAGRRRNDDPFLPRQTLSQRFYSDNDTGTFADTLKAIGLAEVLASWLRHLERDADGIVIEDKGAYYQIELPSPVDESSISQIQHPFVAGRGRALVTSKGAAKAGQAGRDLAGFEYDARRAETEAYFAQLRKLGEADRRRLKEHPDEFGLVAPHPDLGLYVYINHFKIADGYNALLDQWRGADLDGFRANLRLIFAAFEQHPNDLVGTEDRWDAQAKAGMLAGKGRTSLLQLVNPASGKGGNSFKANGLGMGNLDGFWLAEYLKFVGLFTIAAPFIVADSKDRKTYVLRPIRVELGVLRSIMEDFRSSLYSTTSVKLDILAALRFTGGLISYTRDAIVSRADNDPLLALFGERPRVTDIASGFDVAFYKDMGSAYATMNLATINLPGWLGQITSREVADDALALLKEHEQVIASIKQVRRMGGRTTEDEGSDEIELLRRYRDFLSGADATRFFDFAARYGDYYLAKRHRNQWASQLTTHGMENFMAQSQSYVPYTPILQDEGFRAIAMAIRLSTVVAQYRAVRESGYPYEVRYGLGQDLLRAAAYPADFLARLGEFIQSYNAENARIDERIAKGSLHGAARRPSIRAGHLEALVALVDAYQDKGGSELICKMLVAYGYARDPRAPGDADAAPADKPVAAAIPSGE
jgi:hypothetical protein